MKVFKLLPSIFLIIILLCSYDADASECYHYHTKSTYSLAFADGKNYLVYTVKDPDVMCNLKPTLC